MIRRWFRKDHYYKSGEQVLIVIALTVAAGAIALTILATVYHLFPRV